jgi:hypothetical protein
MATVTLSKPPASDGELSIDSTSSPDLSAYLSYIRSRSPAQIAASSPPAADLISTITSLASAGSEGTETAHIRHHVPQVGVPLAQFGEEGRIGEGFGVAQGGLGLLEYRLDLV